MMTQSRIVGLYRSTIECPHTMNIKQLIQGRLHWLAMNGSAVAIGQHTFHCSENTLKDDLSAGGKLVAYVYHMNKQHWCGDDIEYSNTMWGRKYDTARKTGIHKSFFQPNPDEWYTIWSHVAMNTAGMLP